MISLESFPSAFIERFDLAGEASSGTENVYRAIEKALDRQVAVKFLAPDLITDEAGRTKFLNEGTTLGAVRHPNLVEVYDVDGNEERPFIVFEYIDGFSLKEEIGRMGIIPVRHACDYMIQICHGLTAIHEQKLIHRNLKPRNILIDRLGVAKILDFGFVIPEGKSAAGEDGAVLGTPAYMSPEQARGKNIGIQTDIYAAGVVFFEMLTGSTPFWGADAKSVMKSHVRDKVPSLKDFNPLLPEKLRAIVYRMLHKDLSVRYDTTAKIIRDLNSFLSGTQWQKEIGVARKEFLKNEEDTSYKGVKGAIGSPERIKAARTHVETQRARRKAKKKRIAKKEKYRKNVTYLRTAFVLIVLTVVVFLIYSDSNSVVKIKNLFATLGIGSGHQVEATQRGRSVVVHWRTPVADASQIKVIAPFSQYFTPETGALEVTEHVAEITGALKNGDLVRFVIAFEDGTVSSEFNHRFNFEPLIKTASLDGAVTNAFAHIETNRNTSCTLKIKGASPSVILFPESRQKRKLRSSDAFYFTSTVLSTSHSFSIPSLPSGESYKAEFRVTCQESPTEPPVSEEKFLTFSTKEPEYTEVFVSPSGKEITGTPLPWEEQIVLAVSNGVAYSISPETGAQIWSTEVAPRILSRPVRQGNRILVNTVSGYSVLDSATGKLVAALSLPGKEFTFAPLPYSVKGVILSQGNGTIVCFDNDAKDPVWEINYGRTILCSPLVADKTLYIVDALGFLSSRHLSNGSERWSFRTGNKITATPSVLGKYVFLSAMDNFFYAVYQSRGVVSWRKQAGLLADPIALIKESSPGAGSDESFIYMVSASPTGASLTKLQAKGGGCIWEVNVDTACKGTPVVSEGRVYVTGRDGIVYCFSAIDGLKLWKIDTGAEFKGNLIVCQGYILGANFKGAVIRIKD